MVRVLGVGVETADMLVYEILLRHLRDRKAVPATPASPARQTRVTDGGASGDLREPAALASGAA